MTNLGNMNKLLNDMADAPFKFGKNDCYTFTARLVREWHGIDYCKHHSGYKTEADAAAYMERHGGIEALTTGTLGYAVDPVDCRDGDVVTADVGPGIALGFVFDGHGLFKAKNKVLRKKLNKCRKGWRIG